MARPSKYTTEIANKICELIATSSRGLRSICEEVEINPTSIYEWIDVHPEFSKQYARAKELQADFMVDEMLEIADDATRDTKQVDKGGKIVDVEDTEWTNRSKLRIETRKWLAGKLRAKKYGDKLDVTTDGEKINNVKVEVIKSDAPLSNSEKDIIV